MGIRTSIHAVIWAWRHLKGIYHVEEIRTLSPYIRETDNCIDVGAHAGSWTVPLSRLVPRGQVYAFEALPYYSDTLKKTLDLLNCRGVTVVNAAVQDKCQSLPIIYESDAGKRITGYTHIARNRESVQSAVFVPGITLDSFFESIPNEIVRFIKCDVEGAELLVFRGALRLIETMRPIVYSELNSEYCQGYGYEIDELFEFWVGLDYGSYSISPSKEMVRVSKEEFSGKGDLLFLPFEVAGHFG